MTRVVLLDAGPLGLVTNPRRSTQSTACAQWLQAMVTDSIRVIIPEIADYEVRRELLRANKLQGVARLDALARRLEYLPIWQSLNPRCHPFSKKPLTLANNSRGLNGLLT